MFYDPDRPENHTKGKEKGKGEREREKRLAIFRRLKKDKKGYALLQSGMLFKNPGKYITIVLSEIN